MLPRQHKGGFRLHVLGDVPIGAEHPQRGSLVVAKHLGHGLDVANFPVGPDDAVCRVEWLFTRDRLRDFLVSARKVVGVQRAPPGLFGAAKVFSPDMVKREHRIIPSHLMSDEVPLPDTYATVGCGEGQALFLFQQLIFGLFSLGDIEMKPDVAGQFTVSGIQRLDIQIDPVVEAGLIAIEQLPAKAFAFDAGGVDGRHGERICQGGADDVAGDTTQGFGQRVTAQAREPLVNPGDAAMDVGDDHRIGGMGSDQGEHLRLALGGGECLVDLRQGQSRRSPAHPVSINQTRTDDRKERKQPGERRDLTPLAAPRGQEFLLAQTDDQVKGSLGDFFVGDDAVARLEAQISPVVPLLRFRLHVLFQVEGGVLGSHDLLEVLRHGITCDQAQGFIAQGHQPIGPDIGRGKDGGELIQRDRAVDEAAKRTVGPVDAAGEDGGPFLANAPDHRFGDDQAGVGVAAEALEVGAIGYAAARARVDPDAIGVFPFGIDHTQTIEVRQQFLMPFNKRIERRRVDAIGRGELLFDLIDHREHRQVDAGDRVGDVRRHDMGDVFGGGFGNRFVVASTLGDPDDGQADQNHIHQHNPEQDSFHEYGTRDGDTGLGRPGG